MLDRHREHHALLRLGQPDLPRREPRVLERDGLQLDVGADPLGHLADRRRQPASPAVRDGGVEPVGGQDGVDDQLLGDRVADLHAGTRHLARGGVHRGGREGRAPQAVAPGATADHHHAVARRRPRERWGIGGQTDAPGEHERVGGVALVVEHGARDRGQAELVAVVGHTGHHA
ncbi:MAG: hypothetical protein MUE78_07000, partial [Ilumatobacteraceae bacterium]|nr:hypothetical protein [Ilumatobacteraceae bacterium]